MEILVSKKRALLIGDNDMAKYHPLHGFDALLKSILSNFELHVSTDYLQFDLITLKKYDFCIVMCDRWVPLENSQAQGLKDFIEQGGGLLMIHQGISLQNTPLLTPLMGGRFTHHPEQTVLTYQINKHPHFITSGLQAFSSKEEPYQFIMNTPMNTTVLLEYELNHQMCIAGWAHSYELGKVVYLSPGHNLETLHQPNYQELIRRSALWLTESVHLS